MKLKKPSLKLNPKISELQEFMAYMRSPEGCPWDREQNFGTIKKTFKSEFEECLNALERKDYANLKEELGDLLWNIIFLARLAEEKGYFSFRDVVYEMQDKIIRRHPHVFGTHPKLNSAQEVMKIYQKIKENEKEKSKN